MRCPVCHGSGISPATMGTSFAIECGACQGSGWLPDPDLDPPAWSFEDDADAEGADAAGAGTPADAEGGATGAAASAADVLGTFPWMNPSDDVLRILERMQSTTPASTDPGEPAPDAAPVQPPSPGTGALDASSSFQAHLDSILGRTPPEPTTDPHSGDDLSALSDVEMLQRRLEVDRRSLREIPNTMPGRADGATVERLEAIAADYRALAAADRTLPGLDRASLDRKVADTLRSLGQARESLAQLDGAERAYEEARSLYLSLDATHEAAGIDHTVRQLRLHRDADVDDALSDLHGRLETATDGIDRAEILIELGELHARRHDDLEAGDLFQRAENELEPYAGEVSGAATADALASSLAAIMGDAPAPTTPIEDVMRVRGLLQRLYAGLTQTLAASHPDEARHYLELRRELEGSTDQGSTDNARFSARMSELLGGLLDQTDGLAGGDDPT